MSKYEWYRDIVGEFRWRLKASNGRIVASGEGYKTRHSVLRGIEAHRRTAQTAIVKEAK